MAVFASLPQVPSFIVLFDLEWKNMLLFLKKILHRELKN